MNMNNNKRMYTGEEVAEMFMRSDDEEDRFFEINENNNLNMDTSIDEHKEDLPIDDSSAKKL